MEKYGVDMQQVEELLKTGAAKNKEDALEKVASGQGPELIKKAKAKQDESNTEDA